MDDGKAIVQRFEEMKTERAVYTSHWQEIAELVRPMRAEFTAKVTPGTKRTSKLYDSTALVANENLASGLWGMITNASSRWFELRHDIEELNDRAEVQVYLEDMARVLRSIFNTRGQQFYARAFEVFRDLCAFGPAVHFVDDNPVYGVVFHSPSLADCYIAENDASEVDTLYRLLTLTARQALMKFGDGTPARVRKEADRHPDTPFDFIHAVEPRPERNRASRRATDLPVRSTYVFQESAQIVRNGGYHEFPYQVPRWGRSSGSRYGESVAMLALPDVKMINRMSRTTLVGAEKVVDPVLMAADDAVGPRGLRTSAGSIIKGAIDPMTGRAMIQPLITGGQIGLGLELEEQRRNAIREGFHWSLLLMVERNNATATEVLARQEEKFRLLGPHLGRLTSEFLDPLVKRVHAIAGRLGLLPPPPDIIRQYPQVRVDYVSPLARAAKVAEASAMQRALDGILPLAAVQPEVMDVVDGDEAVRVFMSANGVSPKVLRGPDQVAAMRQARQQQQAAMAAAQLAPGVGQATRDFAQAGQIAAGGQAAGRA